MKQILKKLTILFTSGESLQRYNISISTKPLFQKRDFLPTVSEFTVHGRPFYGNYLCVWMLSKNMISVLLKPNISYKGLVEVVCLEA